MNLQYVTDKKGNTNAVIMSLSDWEKIKKELEELESLKGKKAFFNGLKDAFNEVKLIKEGKKNPNSFEDLLDEL